jgi:predicted ArsR family transcriptional regulator
MKSTDSTPLRKLSAQEAILAAMPGRTADLAAATGLAHSTVKKLVRVLKDAGLIHTKALIPPKVKGKPAPVYALGSGEPVSAFRLQPLPAHSMHLAALRSQAVRFPLSGVWA